MADHNESELQLATKSVKLDIVCRNGLAVGNNCHSEVMSSGSDPKALRAYSSENGRVVPETLAVSKRLMMKFQLDYT